ncbi:hypothetical protein U1Q18_023724 [Sarracenia purpurea var. burkii]
MEVLNPTISIRPQFFATVSIFSRRYALTSLIKTNPYRFNIGCIPNSKLPLDPPSLTFSPVSATGKLRISARFGRPTRRRNSLRKKLTEQQQEQQVRPPPVVSDPSSGSGGPVHDYDNGERYDSNLDNDNVQESMFNSNYDANEGTVQSNSVEESISKPLVESVLWNKLESWVDQYKNDSEFWGLGFSPIFTVFRDLEGNVNRVVVNEDEILRRGGIDAKLYKHSELEEFTQVNSKILHAKFLAREMESGNHVISKNSSVAKFVVPGRQWGFVNAIRSLTVQPGLSLKLPRIGTMVLCGFLVFWAMKTLFTRGDDKAEYTRFEKEIMKRKIKARKEREKLVKGNVEVLQDSLRPQVVSGERPKLNKQELTSFIMKAKESTSNQATSKDFDSKILEIRAMARHAREIENRDPSLGDSGVGDDLTVNEPFDEKEVIKRRGGLVESLQNDLSNEYLSQTSDSNGNLTPTPFNHVNSEDIGFREKASVENSEIQTSSTSIIKNSSDDDKSTIQDVVNQKTGVNISDTSEVILSSNALKKSFRTKPRVICSAKEAREFLSRKHYDQQPNLVLQDRTVPEGASVLMIESEKEIGCIERQKSDKNHEVSESTILDGISDLTSSINDPEAAGERHRVAGPQMVRALVHEANIGNTETGPSVLVSPRERQMDNNTNQGLDTDNNGFQPTILDGPSDSASSANACEDCTPKTTKDGDPEDVDEGHRVDDVQMPRTSFVRKSNGRSAEPMSVNRENWMEKNFHKLEPVVKKIQCGFRDNYMVAREKVKQDLDINSNITQPKSDQDDGELDWMKDDRLREIVFQVQENELAGHDPFYLMDNEDKLAFFEGLERKVERENEKLLNLHEWLHSNIENLDYGADGISLYDPPEKIIPRWKGPPVGKNPDFVSNFAEQRKAPLASNFSNSDIEKKDGQNIVQKSKVSSSDENIMLTSSLNNQNTQIVDGALKRPKIVIEGSDGSVRAGKKSGKEYWQHTKKWSRGFLESYNAETDPEIKAVMKDMGKDLDRWITEKEIQEAADLMNMIPKRGQQFIEKKLNKVKREMELFGPQAVVSKYREYAEEKEEDYLWWLDIPFVLCIELYTHENGEQRTGFYSLEMATDLELDPKQYHVIAFEDPGDCKNLCYIIQAHMEMLGNGSAFVVARPPKDAFREAKANGFNVTVIRKRELQLNVDQTLEEVEEQITEIGSKIYHDRIMQERSVDLSALTKGVLGASKSVKRRRSRRKLKKPTV